MRLMGRRLDQKARELKPLFFMGSMGRAPGTTAMVPACGSIHSAGKVVVLTVAARGGTPHPPASSAAFAPMGPVVRKSQPNEQAERWTRGRRGTRVLGWLRRQGGFVTCLGRR